jgi:regulator of replication initiation timing
MGILDNAKEVARAVEEIHNLELYKRVLSLHSDIIALVEENIRLRDENKELAKTVALKKAMNFVAPFFYQEGDKTPYCPSCWEAKQQAIHVIFNHVSDDYTRWDCPSCQHMYLDKKGAGRRFSSAPDDPAGPEGWMR